MEYNEEQWAAITADQRYLMVLAGAGTGKTRTIIGRAAHLIESGVDPKRIAVVSFTRRAAAEITERLRHAVGDRGRRVVTGTFHHLCLRNMRARPRAFGFDGMTILDRDDQVQLLRLIRSRLVEKNSKFPQAAELLNYLSYARNTNQSPREYLIKFTDMSEQWVDLAEQVFQAYKQRKQAGGYLDYDDILHRFAEVLRADERVREMVCRELDHLLVDEMQDTNPLQWLILESYAQHASLFCVGDDAQSIYAFRGADFQNVHSFEKRLPGARTLKLTLNYRSTQPILDVANWLLDASPLPYRKRLRAVRPGNVKPRFLQFDSDLDQAEWVAKAIQNRRQGGAKWSDHMILCRTAWTARPMEAALIERNIPYRFIGGLGLLQVAHVRDVLSAIRIVVNPRDELAWMRYLTLFPGIGDVTAGRFAGKVENVESVEQSLEMVSQDFAKHSHVHAILVRVAKKAARPTQAIRTAVKGLESTLEASYDDWERRTKDLDLLERLAAKHESLRDFLETYTLDPVSVAEPEEEDDDGVVTLITVHSAKGTESPVCFVISAQAGSYPHSRSVGDRDAEEEERRVLYVALTRAQDELYITRHPPSGFNQGYWRGMMSTPDFVEDMPLHLVDYGEFATPIYQPSEDDVIR